VQAVGGIGAALERIFTSSIQPFNYGGSFLRDNVPVMVYLDHGKRRFDTSSLFSASCLDLPSSRHLPDPWGCSHQFHRTGRAGLIADYGQRFDRQDHLVDAKVSVAHPLLALRANAARTGLRGQPRRWQRRVFSWLLDLVLHPSFEGTPVLSFVPDLRLHD